MNERGDWDDRLVDASLHELHGQRPPDLSSRVVDALEQRPAPDARIVVLRSRRRLVSFVVAAAALLGIAVVVQTHYASADRARIVAEHAVLSLDVEVQRGEVEFAEFAGIGDEAPRGASRHRAVTVAPFVARPGNRLKSAEPSRLRIGPFGVVDNGTNTELEVASMEFTWKNGVAVASTLTVAVVAGVVTWHGLTRNETAAAGETLRMQASSPDDKAAQVAAENERLRRRIAQLEQENGALRTTPERDAVQPVVEQPPPPPPPETPASSMVFTDETYAAALEGIDWKTMGEVTKEMGPMLAELVEAMKDGKEMPPDLGVKISQLNMKLVAQVPALMKSGLPGYGPNGAYTHPLVVANVLANTLAASGQALTPAQQGKIEGLVRSFTVENQSIAASTHEFAVEQLLAEAEMKDRFYAEIGSQLAPEQQETMNPKGASAYDGAGLFNTGLMTRPFAEGVPVANAAEFARVASNRLGEDLGLDEATAAQVRGVVERVTAAAPELWRDASDTTERNLRMLKSGRTAAALRRQVEVLREIQRKVPLTPEQLKKLKAMKGVLVPLPKGSK